MLAILSGPLAASHSTRSKESKQVPGSAIKDTLVQAAKQRGRPRDVPCF